MPSDPNPARNADYSAGTLIANGTVYVLDSTGSFAAERQFADVSLNVQSAPVRVDITGAVQIKYSAAALNSQLGAYITASDTYTNDSVTISCEDLDGIVAGDVLSVGALSTLNTDFAQFITTYFGIAGGFESLYNEEQRVTDISGAFGASQFVSLVSSASDDLDAVTHAGIKKLTGHITVSNVGQLIRYIVDGNIFNNRAPSGTAGGANDWGLAQKFQAGDLIWSYSGISVVYKLGINNENMLPQNSLALAANITGGTAPFNFVSSGTTSLLTRTTQAPILFVLTA